MSAVQRNAVRAEHGHRHEITTNLTAAALSLAKAGVPPWELSDRLNITPHLARLLSQLALAPPEE